jgi:tRNA A-37 threonylcarbamoyl transferase component Bud32
MDVSDSVLDHLRHVAALPDFSGTRYELESEIGRGGMGVVYAARDRQLDRRVALKVLDSTLAGEAQLIAGLEHPAIVPIYETGELPDGRAFYAMKLVSGARLDRYLAGSPSLGERLRVIRRVGEALAFAHTSGAIHRDLKPQNVMVGEFGEVYVMDWGVDAIAGTPAFRAPDARLDQRSDIYALGAVLEFMLTAPGSPSAPPALRAIATKAMSADPAARYPDAAALLADIDRFQEGRAVEAWSEPLWHRLRRFGSRNAVLLWLLAAYAVVKFALFFLRTR